MKLIFKKLSYEVSVIFRHKCDFLSCQQKKNIKEIVVFPWDTLIYCYKGTLHIFLLSSNHPNIVVFIVVDSLM